MPYTSPSLTQALADLGSRLNDPASIHWTDLEKTRYLCEALRTWNALTSHFRDQGSFTATLNEPFYDLPTVLPALRAQTVTNWDLVLDIQYALLEPPSAATWVGTDQFTLAQVSQAIQRRRDQFLRETNSVVTRSTTAYGVTGTGRIALSESVLQVRRAAWRPDATALLLPLLRTDEWAANHYQPTWVTPSTAARPPRTYSTSVVPPLTMQILPPPSGAGTLDLVSINKGLPLVPTLEMSLGIPNDWAWVVKWGALADLLSGDGLALDVPRSTHYEQRWQQGLDGAKKAAVVLAARINGVPCVCGDLSSADTYQPTWQLVGGVPRKVLLSGQTLLALNPPPGATGSPWTIVLDVIRNAPVPVNGVDVLQVSQDIYDVLLDYAQYIALSKEGPGELEGAMGLLERFGRAAGVDLGLQQAQQPSRSPLLQQTRTDEDALPRELDAVSIE